MIWTNKELKEKVTFEKIVAMWLKDEWHYPFYDGRRQLIPEKIINNPDISSLEENKIRLELLIANRGGIIDKLPKNIEWHITDFRKEDIDRIFLIPMRNGWVSKMTKGSCKLIDSLNEENWNMESKEHIDRIKEMELSIDAGKINDKLVFIASGISSPLTCIEGNHRLIALTLKALKEKNMDIILEEVYLGISPSMKDCLLNAEKYFF
ncbi:MAG: hypothetical protein WAW11_04050 [Patescibacteria group bacterium]